MDEHFVANLRREFSDYEAAQLSKRLDTINFDVARDLVRGALKMVKITWPQKPKWCVNRLNFAFHTCPIETIYDLILLHDVLSELQTCYGVLLEADSQKMLRFITTKNLIAEKIVEHLDKLL